MARIPQLPASQESVEAAIDRLIGSVAALSTISEALLTHVMTLAPQEAETLELHLAIHAEMTHQSLQSESETVQQHFKRAVANAQEQILTFRRTR